MTRVQDLRAVFDGLKRYDADQPSLIVSFDRPMDVATARKCTDAVIALRRVGRRIVGHDLYRDHMVRDCKG